MSNATDNTNLNTCGCCEAELATPSVKNPPGQPALSYRIGVHGSFLRRMIARLPKQRIPDGDNQELRPLAALTTRASSDPSIALLDAWASVGHVLSFYQERIANEGFLRTATERRSVLEMARAISYELSPGVAAESYLAFSVDESDSTPNETSISAGTQVQSIPSTEGELPQTFETSQDFEAKAWWNALRPRTTKTQVIEIDSDEIILKTTNEKNKIYLEGVNLNLAPGDRMLLAGNNGQTVSKRVRKVEPEIDYDQTIITFEGESGSVVVEEGDTDPGGAPRAAERAVVASAEVLAVQSASANESIEAILALGLSESEFQVAVVMAGWVYADVLDYVAKRSPESFTGDIEAFVFRESAGIFGHNAPYYLSLPKEIRGSGLAYPHDWDNPDWNIWFDSIKNAEYSPEHLYLERSVSGITEGSWLALERPDDYKVYQITSSNEGSKTGFGISSKVTGLTLTNDDGSAVDKDPAFKVRKTTAFVKSEQLELAAIPNTDDLQAAITNQIELDSLAPGLQIGQAIAISGEQDDAEGVMRSEIKLLQSISHLDGYTTLTFTEALKYGYKRDTVTINANVVHATHGETVSDEVLGNGDGASPHLRFKMKKPPLTHVSAASASGAESTLTVRVDGVRWAETASLYGLNADDRNYIIRIDDDANAFVSFGDGKSGARLPTGSENVTATYRSGIGSAGEVLAGNLTLMKTRPFGVKGVNNPTDASGSEDPETLDNARTNAPLTVLTLDRIVSLQDFEDFACAYAGIGKAKALTIWDGVAELVYITIAGASGGEVDASSDLYKNLKNAIDAARDPLRPVKIDSFQPRFFDLHAKLLIDPDYEWDTVTGDIKEALVDAYSFAKRAFSQPVTSAEVLNIIHDVPGLIAVDLEKLHLVDAYGKQVGKSLSTILPARTASLNPNAGDSSDHFSPAELLLINEPGITFSEME